MTTTYIPICYVKVPTCAIQWIDKQGNPTPDTNPAVALIQCMGIYSVERVGYVPEPSEVFPCCAEHLKQIPYHNPGNWRLVASLPSGVR